MSSKTSYCWDTSVFVAWLKAEQSAPLADIHLVVGEIDSQKAVLIVSVTTISEMLRAKYSQQQWNTFEQFLMRSNVISVNITPQIARKASEIRNAGLAEARKIRTPDAEIMATAILHRADVLHSLDPDQLNLNASPVVDGLRITRPILITGQKGLLN